MCVASTNVTIVIVRIEEPVRSADSSANTDCFTNNGLFCGHCFDVFAKGGNEGRHLVRSSRSILQPRSEVPSAIPCYALTVIQSKCFMGCADVSNCACHWVSV